MDFYQQFGKGLDSFGQKCHAYVHTWQRSISTAWQRTLVHVTLGQNRHAYVHTWPRSMSTVTTSRFSTRDSWSNMPCLRFTRDQHSTVTTSPESESLLSTRDSWSCNAYVHTWPALVPWRRHPKANLSLGACLIFQMLVFWNVSCVSAFVKQRRCKGLFWFVMTRK